jgi:hypothetical protein
MPAELPLIEDELDLLAGLVPLQAQRIVELGCGAAALARGHLYVSEPVYAGPFNDVVRLFNDEGVVRAKAQAALDEAIGAGGWTQVAERRFQTPVHFRDFADFEERLMRPTFADHRLDARKIAEVRAAFEPHLRADGAHFVRPMHVRLLRRS